MAMCRVKQNRLLSFGLLVSLVLHAGQLSAVQLRLELVASKSRIDECADPHVEISFRLRNPERLPIGGFHAFVRFPGGIFEALRYETRDLKGLFVANGPAPLGSGFRNCDVVSVDPWDDGKGFDAVAIAATAFGDGDSGPVTAEAPTLGAFVFRLRSGLPIPDSAVDFQLEFDGCDPDLLAGAQLYDADGRFLEFAFATPLVSVGFLAGVRVRDLACAFLAEEGQVVLSWNPPLGVVHDGVSVYRNGQLLRAVVPAAYNSALDDLPAQGEQRYEVVVLVRGKEDACRASCAVIVTSTERSFVRGDANGDQRVNISDPITVLGHLFFGDLLSCEDADDVDDNGSLEVTDAVVLLTHLFQAGAPPLAPYPDPGRDPTADSLDC